MEKFCLGKQFLISVKNKGCFRTQKGKIHCRMKKSPYLCTVKRNKNLATQDNTLLK